MDRNDSQTPFAISGEREAGTNVLFGPVGEVRENLVFRHSRSEVLKDALYGHAQSTDARLAVSLIWFDSNKMGVVHTPTVIRGNWNVNATPMHIESSSTGHQAAARGMPERNGATFRPGECQCLAPESFVQGGSNIFARVVFVCLFGLVLFLPATDTPREQPRVSEAGGRAETLS